jgi:hypothetical protein
VKGEKGRCWSSLQGLNYFQLSKPGKIPQYSGIPEVFTIFIVNPGSELC